MDLNHGFDAKTERDENVDEHLDGLCEALLENEKLGKKGERRGGIITWRGMITRSVMYSILLCIRDNEYVES